MRALIRTVAATAGAMAVVLSSGVAFGSTISKNLPGAIRHPVNQAAIAVGADTPDHHHTYTRHRVYSSRVYTSGRHHHYSRHHHSRHHSR